MSEKNNGTAKPEEVVDYGQVYAFLTKEFFQRILQKSHGSDTKIVVHDFSLDAALPKGENFASQMVRAIVNYSSDGGAIVEKKFVLKLAFAKKEMNDIMEEMNLFTKEIHLYTEILPKVHAMLRGIGDDTKLAPICYEGSDKLNYIVFEDLKESSYANIDKVVGFKRQHLQALYNKLAKYHAGTAKLLLDNEIETSMFESHPLSDNVPFVDFLVAMYDLAAEAIATWDGFEEIAERIRKFQPTYRKKILESVKRDPEEFELITHGDLWSNNIMFKISKDGSVEDLLMVDFQCGYHGSPVLDITNSFYASGDRTMPEEDFDLAVQHYHKTLSETLKAFNYPADKIPTLRQLRSTMFRRIGNEITLALHMNSFKGRALSFDLEEMMNLSPEGLEKYRKLYARPEFREYSEQQVRYMDRKGLFE